jgi:hypothetical protein
MFDKINSRTHHMNWDLRVQPLKGALRQLRVIWIIINNQDGPAS